MLHAGLVTLLGGRNPWRYCGRHGEILSAEHPRHLTHTHGTIFISGCYTMRKVEPE